MNLLSDGVGVSVIPTVTIRRELKQGLLHPIKVAKRFPPMPIIATYQATTDRELMQTVVQQARASAADYCASVDPATAWID